MLARIDGDTDRKGTEILRVVGTDVESGGYLPLLWHSCGMSRSRVSTTVDEGLLIEARLAHPGQNDAALFDAALAALLARSRAFAIDAAYDAYEEHPIDEPDEWGDLGSFRSAAAAS